MPKIYQRFDLDKDAAMDISGADLAQAGTTLREELTAKGYHFLSSNTDLNGVPESVILGGDLGMAHKEDFYRVAQRLRLPYHSGLFYTGCIWI